MNWEKKFVPPPPEPNLGTANGEAVAASPLLFSGSFGVNGFAGEVVLAEGVKPGFDVDAACPKRGADDVEGFLDAVEGGKSVFAGEVFGVVDSGATLFDSGVAGLEAVAGFPESVSDSDDLVLENVLAKMSAVAESPCVRLAAGESV